MPSNSPEALERKRQKAKLRKRAKRTATQVAPAIIKKPSPNRLTFRGPAGPEKSKSELRAILAEAMFNTARL
jgi:hypothetical protein